MLESAIIGLMTFASLCLSLAFAIVVLVGLAAVLKWASIVVANQFRAPERRRPVSLFEMFD